MGCNPAGSVTSPISAVSVKPRVLTFASYYLPGFKSGGPPRSISNLARALAVDFEFLIVTRNRDLGERKPYPGVPCDGWIESLHGPVNYRSPRGFRLTAVARLLRETSHDVLYLNSVFDTACSTLPLLARQLGLAPIRPLVIAPRGELGAGALALKRGRKAFYLGIAQKLGLFREALWMASSEREAEDIQRVLKVGSDRLVIASDIVGALPAELPGPPARALGDPLRVIFLARISPMKNLEYALDLLSCLDDVPVNLDVVGPCSDPKYLSALRCQAEKLPQSIKVSFTGEIQPIHVPDILSCYDLLLLPTRGENFGHVICEALQAGTPVLISDRTPWRTTLDQACVAVSLDDPGKFRRIIRERALASPEEQMQLRAAARHCAALFGDDPGHITANRALFLRAAAEANPDVVVNSDAVG